MRHAYQNKDKLQFNSKFHSGTKLAHAFENACFLQFKFRVGLYIEMSYWRNLCGLSAHAFIINGASAPTIPWPRTPCKWMLKIHLVKEQNFFHGNAALHSDSICLPLVGSARMCRHPPRLTWVVTSHRARNKPAFINCWHLWGSHNKIRTFLLAV